MPWWVLWAGAGVLVLIAGASWWWVPQWQANRLSLKIRDPKSRADLENEFRKTIGQLLGGAAVLIGAGFAWVEWQGTQQTTRDQINASLKSSNDQIISQQVAKGFELLGDDRVARRLGGIYALESVMNTSEPYHEAVVEALCAFVRDNAVVDKDKKRSNENIVPQQAPHADVQAALTVIGRRALGQGFVDLHHTELVLANLSDADLAYAELTYANLASASMIGTNLTGALLNQADLTGAELTRANLTGANLTGADLTGADLTYADLARANLTGTNLTGANLTGANLTGADLTGARHQGGADHGDADQGDAEVSQSQLDKACGDINTSLPFRLTIKACQ